MSCSLTLLRARGPRLAKTLNADGTMIPYGDAKTFDMAVAPVASLADLAAGLAQLLPRPDLCVVRGAIADPAHARGVRRLLHPDPETGEVPTLREVPRRWLALDLDELDAPDGLDRRDLSACTEVVRGVLPHRFSTTSSNVDFPHRLVGERIARRGVCSNCL